MVISNLFPSTRSACSHSNPQHRLHRWYMGERDKKIIPHDAEYIHIHSVALHGERCLAHSYGNCMDCLQYIIYINKHQHIRTTVENPLITSKFQHIWNCQLANAFFLNSVSLSLPQHGLENVYRSKVKQHKFGDQKIGDSNQPQKTIPVTLLKEHCIWVFFIFKCFFLSLRV